MHMPLATPEVDQMLLAQYVDERDPAAFTRILGRHGDSVFQTCRRVLGDRALAQEATQETFLRLVRRPEAVQHSLGGWLHRTAHRIAIDAVRRNAARRQREADHLPRPAARSPEADEASLLVRDSLAALPEEERSLLVRHYVDGVPQRRLARQMNVSPATLSRRMSVALAALRQEICRRDSSLQGMLVLLLAALSVVTSAMGGRRWGTLPLFPAPADPGRPAAPTMVQLELAPGLSPSALSPAHPRIASFQNPATASAGTLLLVFTDGRRVCVARERASVLLEDQTLRDLDELARHDRVRRALSDQGPAASNAPGHADWTGASLPAPAGTTRELPHGPAATFERGESI